jgi:hypothetical protein
MKKQSLLLILLIFCVIGNAQEIDSSLLAQFPPSVINRLVDVSKLKTVEADRQRSIAILFMKEDSAVQKAVLNKADPVAVEAIKQNTQNQIQQLLTQSEYAAYKNVNQLFSSADNYARVLTLYYLDKYKLDSAKHYFGIYRHLKVQGLLLLPLGYKAETPADVAKQLASFYENNVQKMLNEYEGLYIYKQYEDSLQKIKPLTKGVLTRLKENFLNQCRLYNHRSYAEHFITSMHGVIKDTTYYAAWYKKELKEKAEANTRQSIVKMLKQKVVSREAAGNMRKIIYDHFYTNAVYDITYLSFPKEKDSLIARTDKLYDSLMTAQLMHEGEFDHVTLLSTAIKNKKKLQLRPTLVDTLVGHAIVVNNDWTSFNSKNPWGRFDYLKYEIPVMETLLTDEQYRQVLKIKNSWQAEEWAKDDWGELNQRGIAAGLDSLGTVHSMQQYNVNMLILKDRYANDKERLNNELSALNNTMPAALKMLKRARVTGGATVAADNKKSPANTDKQQPLKESFKW